jgi:hypothetical protein
MSAPRKLSAISATLAIFAFAAALFSPALFDGKILAPLDITTHLYAPWNGDANGEKPHNHNPSDAVTQYLPYRIFAEKSFREDGYIGWNPYEMGGYSLAANTMALPGTWTMQLHRFLPFKEAWNLGLIGEFLIAGIGMLVFLRDRKLPWLPCLIGAVAYMFNAQFVTWIYHRWALGSFCWMPWVLWSFGHGFGREKFELRNFLLPGFLAMAMLGGSLQHLAFIVLTCGCLAAAHFDFRRPFANTRSIATWSVISLVALLIASFSLIPQINGYFSNIATGHTRGGLGYENGITQPLLNLLIIPLRIWPWLVGDPQSIDGWHLLKSNFMSLNYLGTVPMVLAFSSLFAKGLPKAGKWLIVVGILTPLTPLVGPLYHRVELLFILGASWMAAEMLAILPTRSRAPRISRGLAMATCAIGTFLLITTCLPSSIRNHLGGEVVDYVLKKSEKTQFGSDTQWIKSRTAEWNARLSLLNPRTAWLYGLLVIGTTGLVLSSRRTFKQKITDPSMGSAPLPETSHSKTTNSKTHGPAWHTAGHLMILAATSLELATLFQTWTTFSDQKNLQSKNEAVETIRKLADDRRVLQSVPGLPFAKHFAPPNLLAAQFIPSIDGYESIQYHSALTRTRHEQQDIRLSLAAVGLAIEPQGQPHPCTESWPMVRSLGTYDVRRNPNPSPILCAGTSPLPTTPSEIASALQSAIAITPKLQTPNRWVFHVPEGVTWLRIAQNWHEGWRWKIAGIEWQTFRNGPDAACWINQVPQNESRIEVQFFPRPLWLTLIASCTAVAYLSLLVYMNIKNRRTETISAKCAKNCSHIGKIGQPLPLLLSSCPLLTKILALVLATITLQTIAVHVFGFFEQLSWSWTATLAIVSLFIYGFLVAWKQALPSERTRFLAPWTSPWPCLIVLLILTQIALYPPTMHDSLSYRLPRIFMALQAGKITNLVTPDWRMNSMPWGWEMMAMPFAIINQINYVKIINLIAFLITYKILFDFSYNSDTKESVRRARLTAIAFATAPVILIQASSTSNDLYTGALLLIGAYFIRKYEEQPSQLPVMASLLALLLAANVKPQFLVFGVAWLAWWLFSPSTPWRAVSWKILAIAFIPYLIVSPILLLASNYMSHGALLGDSTGQLTGAKTNPIVMALAGTIQFLFTQFQLPVFPAPETFSNFLNSIPGMSWLSQQVPKFRPSVSFITLIDNASFGLVHFSLICTGLFLAFRSPSRREKIWIITVALGFLISASQVVPGSIGRSFMGFVCLLLPIACPAIAARCDKARMRMVCLACTLLGLASMALNPACPLWPSMTIEQALKDQKTAPFASELSKYNNYRKRADTGFGMLDEVPQGEPVGTLIRQVTPMVNLWTPDWRSHHINFVHRMKPEEIEASDIEWLIIAGKSQEDYPQLYESIKKSPHWKISKETLYLPNVKQGPETWTLYHKIQSSPAP